MDELATGKVIYAWEMREGGMENIFTASISLFLFFFLSLYFCICLNLNCWFKGCVCSIFTFSANWTVFGCVGDPCNWEWIMRFVGDYPKCSSAASSRTNDVCARSLSIIPAKDRIRLVSWVLASDRLGIRFYK